MKYCKLIIIALFFSSIHVYSQDHTIKHSISKGETISSIAKKYNVSIADIYTLNPEAKKTLHLNQILLIPEPQSKKEEEQSSLTNELQHQVLPKETLYGICKQYKTSLELLYKANPKLESEGLRVGKTIVIPTQFSKKEIEALTVSKEPEPQEVLQHEVKAKESWYGIAKMYTVSVKELQEANPQLGKKGLMPGQFIQIPAKGKKAEEISAVSPVDKKVTTENIAQTDKKANEQSKAETPINTEKEVLASQEQVVSTSEITHIVQSKETKYGIAKKYGITVAELEKQNPAVQKKLLPGYKLNLVVPADKVEEPTTANEVKTVSPNNNTEQSVVVKDSSKVSMPIANEELIDKIIGTASENIGVRYRSGGTTNAGFDCSGLMYSSFGACDIKLPRSSIEQSSIGEKIEDGEAQKGDLIFFKTNGRRQINHVGMVVEVLDDEIKFIHSATHSGVIISSTKEPYYQRNFVQLNRVIK